MTGFLGPTRGDSPAWTEAESDMPLGPYQTRHLEQIVNRATCFTNAAISEKAAPGQDLHVGRGHRHRSGFLAVAVRPGIVQHPCLFNPAPAGVPRCDGTPSPARREAVRS